MQVRGTVFFLIWTFWTLKNLTVLGFAWLCLESPGAVEQYGREIRPSCAAEVTPSQGDRGLKHSLTPTNTVYKHSEDVTFNTTDWEYAHNYVYV